MISRERRDDTVWDVQCDLCSHHDEVEADDFRGAVAALREEGWRPEKLQDESWRHVCPSCMAKRLREARRVAR